MKYPWFCISSGTGFYAYPPRWIEDLSIPFSAIRDYITKIERGESIERPLQKIREERDQIIKGYRELLPTDEDKATFDKLPGLAQKVFPYVEEHLFYVEHLFHGIYYSKIRDIGRVLVNAGFFKEVNDIFT